MNAATGGPRSLLKLRPFIRPFRGRYGLFLTLSAVADFAYTYGFARILGQIVGHASSGRARETALAVAWLLLLVGASSILLPLLRCAFRITANAVEGHLRRTVFAHVRLLPLSFFDGTHSGDTLARLTSDMGLARGAFDSTLLGFLSMTVSGIGGLVVSGSIHWIIMVSAVAIGGTNALVNLLYIAPLQRIATSRQEATSRATQWLVDIFHGIEVIKVFGIEGWAAARHEEGNAGVRKAAVDRANVAGSQLFSVDILRWLSIGGILVIACILGARGLVSVEQILVAGTMGSQVAMLLSYFSQTLGELQGSIVGLERVLDLMDTPVERTTPTAGRPAGRAEGGAAVLMHGVTFSYGDVPVLSGFDLRVEAGGTLAVVGGSGSGKSTLCKILMGLYRPQAGTIAIMGRDYGACPLAELRAATAYVPQSSYLFNGTVRDNIAWGASQASDAGVEAAARAAQAHEFITALADGYRTVVGERGVKLSGGERQRIAIARALLKNAPILLLDEATSSLDTESEHLVQEALRELMRGRTTIVIAHRLATVERADAIVVLEGGRIVERGNHAELLALGGRYAAFHGEQFAPAGAAGR